MSAKQGGFNACRGTQSGDICMDCDEKVGVVKSNKIHVVVDEKEEGGVLPSVVHPVMSRQLMPARSPTLLEICESLPSIEAI